MAVKIVIEPIFEADFEDWSFGFVRRIGALIKRSVLYGRR